MVPRRLWRVLPITREEVWPLQLKHAGLIDGRLRSVLGRDAHVDPRKRSAHRTRDTKPDVGVGGDHQSLGHPIAFEDGVPAAPPERLERAGEERGRPAYEEAHLAAGHDVEGWMVQEPRVERGHAHEDRRARKVAGHLGGVELAVEQYRRAVQQCTVERDEEAMGMEDRKGMEQDVALPPSPGLVQDERVGREVAMR